MQKWAKDNKRDVKPRAEGREFPAVSGFLGFSLVRIDCDVLISAMDVDFLETCMKGNTAQVRIHPR